MPAKKPSEPRVKFTVEDLISAFSQAAEAAAVRASIMDEETTFPNRDLPMVWLPDNRPEDIAEAAHFSGIEVAPHPKRANWWVLHTVVMGRYQASTQAARAARDSLQQSRMRAEVYYVTDWNQLWRDSFGEERPALKARSRTLTLPPREAPATDSTAEAFKRLAGF